MCYIMNLYVYPSANCKHLPCSLIIVNRINQFMKPPLIGDIIVDSFSVGFLTEKRKVKNKKYWLGSRAFFRNKKEAPRANPTKK